MTGKKVLEEILNLLKVFKLSCTVQAFCMVSEELLQAITRLNIYMQEQKDLQAWIPFVQVGICTSRHLYSILDHKKIWMLKDKFKIIDSGFNIVNN